MPVLRHLARDDVDHAAHGVRAVQRGHGAAHHLDALDGLQRRNPALVRAGAAVGLGLARAHALAVHQDQGVVGAHAAQRDVVGVVVRGREDHAGHIAQGIVQVAVGALLQFLARDHRDRGRRLADLLLEAAGRHDQGFQRRPACCLGQRAARGQQAQAGAQRGAAQGNGGGGKRSTQGGAKGGQGKATARRGGCAVVHGKARKKNHGRSNDRGAHPLCCF